MQRRHPLPKLWLMTDERQGDSLWPALEALPRGSGIVVRHYSLGRNARRALIDKVRRIAHRRALVMVVAGAEKLAIETKADGFHNRSAKTGHSRLLRTVAVHNRRELVRAQRIGADAIFLSPAFATRSHPGKAPLGRVRFGMIARRSTIPVIALGGMNARRAKSLTGLGVYGWAAIGALTPESR